MVTQFGPVLLGNLVFRLGGAATGLMLTLYLGWINRELYPVSATALGLIAGSFYLVEMLCAPVLGAQSDRRGRRPFLLVGPVLGFMPAWLAVNAVVGLWLTHAIYQMTAGRELGGNTSSAPSPAGRSPRSWPSTRSPSAWASPPGATPSAGSPRRS